METENIDQQVVLSEEFKKKINEELKRQSERYQKMMRLMQADAPLEVLCLDKKTEEILRTHGFFRVYDILDVDLAKVEFLDARAIRHLASRLNEFISVF